MPHRHASFGFTLALGIAVAGCASAPPPGRTPPAPISTVPAIPASAPPSSTETPAAPAAAPVRVSSIAVPAGVEPYLRLNAKGVQVFRCEHIDGSDYLWRFQRPEAQLADITGKVVATHGANFSFEHSDGSRLAARITAYEDARNVKDLRPVLMAATASGKGAFAQTTHVQRSETNGGLPPPDCKQADLDRMLSVPFSADFVFYRTRAR
jgi:hypothetical protein